MQPDFNVQPYHGRYPEQSHWKYDKKIVEKHTDTHKCTAYRTELVLMCAIELAIRGVCKSHISTHYALFKENHYNFIIVTAFAIQLTPSSRMKLAYLLPTFCDFHLFHHIGEKHARNSMLRIPHFVHKLLFDSCA